MEMETIGPGQIPALADMLTEAFWQDPMYCNALPDGTKRRAFLCRFFRFRLRFGSRPGFGRCTPDCTAAVIWQPPGYEMKMWDVVRYGGLTSLLRAGPQAMKAIMDFNDFAARVQREVCPGEHWHLSPIGVSPSAQGQGIGSALLKEGLERIDTLGESCYLETQSPDAARLYARFGFALLTEMVIPQTAVPHIAMYRPAKKG